MCGARGSVPSTEEGGDKSKSGCGGETMETNMTFGQLLSFQAYLLSWENQDSHGPNAKACQSSQTSGKGTDSQITLAGKTIPLPQFCVLMLSHRNQVTPKDKEDQRTHRLSDTWQALPVASPNIILKATNQRRGSSLWAPSLEPYASLRSPAPHTRFRNPHSTEDLPNTEYPKPALITQTHTGTFPKKQCLYVLESL